MLVPVSWLKDFVDIGDVAIEWLAERMTLAGLEVTTVTYLGIPQTEVDGIRMPTSDHLVWDRERILLGAIREVKSHPDADRLVLAMVDYGGDELEQCITGAPNLFPYKDQGVLDEPLWTAFAMEGAELWDGHSETPKRMTLKGKKLRGVYNRSMVCSEKELGISDEHEGVILMEAQPEFRPGTPLQDILGDVILELDLTPNLARCFSMLGVAREVAALLDTELQYPSFDYLAEGNSIEGMARIRILEPELNQRFTLALLEGAEIRRSPFKIQHRLRMVGQRPINNLVDVTNYITFELGQPLHAFDYDALLARSNGEAPEIITRLPEEGETLTTLDDVERELDDFNILVCDTADILSLGGIIGGAETEISDTTTNVLLEAANWNFINIRRSSRAQKVFTEASTRFSRGVHPSQARLGVQRGIEMMRQLGGGTIRDGIIDEYPLKNEPINVDLPVSEIQRLLGMSFDIQTAADVLSRLEFDVTIEEDTLHVIVPDHRLDIQADPDVGRADLIEEIVRIHGYDHIPNTILEDAMPEQATSRHYEQVEAIRDLMVELGLRENISYRFTTPEAEQTLVPPGAKPSFPDAKYVEMLNPITDDKRVLRHTLLISLLETASQNVRFSNRQQIFEIGKVYLQYDNLLPQEPTRLGILMTGLADEQTWQESQDTLLDFFDMKGVIEGLCHGLHVDDIQLQRTEHTSFHPGRSADLLIGSTLIGSFGELHPVVAKRYKLTEAPVMIAELDLEALLDASHSNFEVQPIPVMPPVLEDIALVVSKNTPASDVESVIRKAGGKLLREVRLFDVYEGRSIAPNQKSLAYSLVYQADDKTLTDKEVAKLRKKIITLTERELGAKLRS